MIIVIIIKKKPYFVQKFNVHIKKIVTKKLRETIFSIINIVYVLAV